jgi:hypothetical protein
MSQPRKTVKRGFEPVLMPRQSFNHDSGDAPPQQHANP